MQSQSRLLVDAADKISRRAAHAILPLRQVPARVAGVQVRGKSQAIKHRKLILQVVYEP